MKKKSKNIDFIEFFLEMMQQSMSVNRMVMKEFVTLSCHTSSVMKFRVLTVCDTNAGPPPYTDKKILVTGKSSSI